MEIQQLMKQKDINAQLLLEYQELQYNLEIIEKQSRLSLDKQSQFYLFKLNTQIQQQNEKIQGFQQQNNRLSNKIIDLEKENKSSKQLIDEQELQILKQQKIISDHSSLISEQKGRIQHLSKENTALEAEIQTLNDRLAKHAREFEQYKIDNSIDDLRNEITSNARQIADQQSIISDLNNCLEQANSDNQSLKDSLKRVQSSYEASTELIRRYKQPKQPVVRDSAVLLVREPSSQREEQLSARVRELEQAQRDAEARLVELADTRQAQEEVHESAERALKSQLSECQCNLRNAEQRNAVLDSRLTESLADHETLRLSAQQTQQQLQESISWAQKIEKFGSIADLRVERDISDTRRQLARLQRLNVVKQTEIDLLKRRIGIAAAAEQIDDFPATIHEAAELALIKSELPGRLPEPAEAEHPDEVASVLSGVRSPAGTRGATQRADPRRGGKAVRIHKVSSQRALDAKAKSRNCSSNQ